MASVIKQLWGPFPSYLKLKTQKSLYQVIGHLPKYGKHALVQPTEWYPERTHNYYKVVRVYPVSRAVMGIRYRRTRQTKIHQIEGKHWGLFYPPEVLNSIKEKLSI
jgi:hypothetical protein